jgi:glyoxylase-like metal-dependent hydrolase (beta-lactamase superfamily II)
MKANKRQTLSSVIFLLLLASALSAQPTADRYAYRCGEITLTLLTESQGHGGAALLIGADADMQARYLTDGAFANAINAFLVRMPGHTILVDAGFGRRLFDHLDALHIAPEQIDLILLTHLHGDHIGGLLRDGRPAFPNATVYLARAEYDYWLAGSHAPQQAVLRAYRSRLHCFLPSSPGDTLPDLLPGLQALAAPGHTPGHTAFLFHSGDDRLLIWGDLTHAMAIQVPCPEVAVTYDLDPVQAVRSRRQLFEYVVRHQIPVAGMHIPFPGMGFLTVGPDGRYQYSALP